MLDINRLMCYNKGTVKQGSRLTFTGNTKASIEKQASLERLRNPYYIIKRRYVYGIRTVTV